MILDGGDPMIIYVPLAVSLVLVVCASIRFPNPALVPVREVVIYINQEVSNES